MANWNIKYPFTAGEAFSVEGVAIALDDGKVANNGGEARGILAPMSKPGSGEHGTMVVLGAARARAGGALSKGSNVTVSTSGYVTAAASGDYLVGYALEAVTSGSLGPVWWNGAATYQVSSK